MTPSGHMGLDGYALILLSVGTKYEPKTGVALGGWRKILPEKTNPAFEVGIQAITSPPQS